MTVLELRFFGELQIHLGNAPLTTWKSQKGRALLCYLVVTDKEHSRSALAGLLWSDRLETSARANLRKTLSRLDPRLRPYLTITREAIAFNQNMPHWLDVAEFELGMTPGSDLSRLQEAVSLYRGDFLDGCYLPDAPLFDEWVLVQRARLREAVLRALNALVIHFTMENDYQKAISYARRLLDIEPWYEEAHRELIGLLALSGRRSAALVQYERCRQILVDELGVEPGEETTALYEHIRDGEFAPSSGQFEITAREREKIADQQLTSERILERSPFSTNLLPQPTKFVGRERELDELDDLIKNRGSRLVTLVGPGGIGKTRLALEFAERRMRSKTQIIHREGGPSYPFPNGIYFVSLESLRSSKLILPAIAEALRYRLDRGEAQLMDYLSSKRLLIVIDNFEHLLEGAEILSGILRSAPGVHILVTSRERLRLQEEQVVPLQGLDFPESALASNIANYSAGKLFLQAARRQRPDFTLDDSDYENLARICQLVEGMPLALELAATWTDTLPMSDIAVEIQSNFDFLATEFRNMPPRHRSVRAVIDVSWEQLLPAEQTMFSQLSVFRGGLTREAATVITGVTIQCLSALVGKSLLRYTKSQDRYYIHELLRQYGGEKLAEQKEEVEEIHDRHSQYYCQWFANQVTPKTMKSAGQRAILDAMTAELENARAAWSWALQNHRIKRLMFRTTAFGMYYVWRGGFQEGERTFRAFAGHLADVDESTDASSEMLRASLLNWQAFFLNELGDKTEAFDLLLESQELLNSPLLAKLDTRAECAHNLVNISRAGTWQSSDIRLEQSIQAQDLYKDVGHPFGIPFALTTGASLSLVIGRMNEARQFLEESLEIYASTGNQLGSAVSLTGLGNLAFVHNDYDKAEKLLRRAVDIAKEIEDLQRVTSTSIYLGVDYLYSGKFSQARRVLENCVAHLTDLGLQTRRAISLYYLGYACLHLGKYEAAAHFGNNALPHAQESNVMEIIAQSVMLPAAVALTNGAFVQALNRFEEANEALGSRQFSRVLLGENCGQIGLGTALLQLGRMDEAQTVFTTLLQQAVATHRQDRLLYALVGIAILLAKQGDAERAVELYSLAARYPFVGNSRWFSDAFGQHIEASSTNLPSTRIEEAKIQGEHRDLWGTADELLLEYGNI